MSDVGPYDPYEHLYVALDYANRGEAWAFLDETRGVLKRAKVGLQLFVREGPQVVVWLWEHFGIQTFLDLKFKDIPNTVKGAVESAVTLPGLVMFNVHADNTLSALQKANGAKGTALCIGVTVLTTYADSLDQDAHFEDTTSATYRQDPQGATFNFADRAMIAGLDGVVCAATEVGALRDHIVDEWRYVVPGIRLEGGDVHDQKRIGTPAGAIRAGATDLVLGRAATKPDSGTSLYALETVAEQMASAATNQGG